MSLAKRKLTLLHISNKRANQPVNPRSLISAGKNESCMSATYEGVFKVLIFTSGLCLETFERHYMHLSRELSFSFKMMLKSFHCTVIVTAYHI